MSFSWAWGVGWLSSQGTLERLRNIDWVGFPRWNDLPNSEAHHSPTPLLLVHTSVPMPGTPMICAKLFGSVVVLRFSNTLNAGVALDVPFLAHFSETFNGVPRSLVTRLV